MKQTAFLMMNLIKSVVNRTDTDCSILTSLSLEQAGKLYTLAKMHDVAPIVGYAIDKSGADFNQQIKEKFQKEQVLAVYRQEHQKFELEQIAAVFENAEIDFIPLKGSVIRNFYPQPFLRTSCDIDILVNESNLEKAVNVLVKELGYKKEERGSHDVSLFSPSNVHVEIHYGLIEDSVLSKADQPLNMVWDYTMSKTEGSRHKLLANEMFYYYHIAHMAKHYVHGGCGVRPFLDLLIINRNMSFDKEKQLELLTLGGLDKFSEQAENLSKVWFDGNQHTDITLQMEDYILKAGVYGNVNNRVAVEQVKKGGKLKYLIYRIWLPYDVIKFHYPRLQKHKWMMPFYQIKRWFKLVFKGGVKRSVNEIKATNNVSEQTKNATQNMIKMLGLE